MCVYMQFNANLLLLSWRLGGSSPLACTVLHYSGVRTTGAPLAGAPVKNVVNRTCPYKPCSFFTPTSIALSCSARTDELSCSTGTDGAETDSFFCQQTSSVRSECFFLLHGKYIILFMGVGRCFGLGGAFLQFCGSSPRCVNTVYMQKVPNFKLRESRILNHCLKISKYFLRRLLTEIKSLAISYKSRLSVLS